MIVRLLDGYGVTQITLKTGSPHGCFQADGLQRLIRHGPGLIILTDYDAATLITWRRAVLCTRANEQYASARALIDQTETATDETSTHFGRSLKSHDEQQFRVL